MTEKTKANRGGAGRKPLKIRLSAISSIMVLMAILVSAILLLTASQSMGGYNSLQTATDRYIACQQDAELFQEGSDCLTNESRYFLITGDAAHARLFMEEVESTRRRDRAVEDISRVLAGDEAERYLAQALEFSNELAGVECYAMRLTADVYGVDVSELPERLRDIALESEDAALSVEDKRARALDLLFGESYVAQKAAIHDNIEKSIEALIADMESRQTASARRLNVLLRRQYIAICTMLVLLIGVVLCVYALVIRPLRRSVGYIRSQEKLPVDGCFEMQFLAQTYNDMFEQHTQNNEKLAYSATHDALTGVYNRTAYESMIRECRDREIGVLYIDVDDFKGVNDTFGHDMGDRVLKRVAKVLLDSFRSDDYVCRIGGDEFCVIMKNADSRLRDVVVRKIERASELLKNPPEDLPPVTLSIGVAFADRSNPSGDIFKDADTAQYRVKRSGGAGCGFY